jgi:hypothetical protein
LSVIQGDDPLVEILFSKKSIRVRGHIRLSAIEYITNVSGATTVHTSSGRDYMVAESPSDLMTRFPAERFDCMQSNGGQSVYFRRERLLGASPLGASPNYAYTFDSRESVYSDQLESNWIMDMTAAQTKYGRAFFRADRAKGFRTDKIDNIELHGAVTLAGLSTEALLKACSIARPVSLAQRAAGQGGSEYRYDWVLDRDAIHAVVPKNPGLGLDTHIGTPFMGIDTTDPIDELIAQLDLTSFIRLTRRSEGRGPNVPSDYNRQHPWAYYRPESILAMEAGGHGTAISTGLHSHTVDETPEEVLASLVDSRNR